MIRKALAALVIMLVYPVFAMASITSDQSVGLADYPWMATGTYSSVFENAAWLGYYRNMVSFERIGAKEGDNVGALTLSPIKGLTLAVFAGIEIPDATWNSDEDKGLFHIGDYDIHSGNMQATLQKDSSVDIDLNDPESDERNALERKNFIVMAAYDWNQMTFGLSVGYSSSWAEDDYDSRTDITTSEITGNDEYLFGNQQFDINLSWLYRITEKISVDASTGYTMYLLENTYSSTYDSAVSQITRDMSYESDGAFDIDLRTSVAWRFAQSQVLHGRIAYSYLNRSTLAKNKVDDNEDTNDTDATDKLQRSGHRFVFGASDEIFISDRVRFHGGLVTEIDIFKRKYTGTDILDTTSISDNSYALDSFSVSLPVVVGLETKLGNYWIWRFGVVSRIYKVETAELSYVSSGGDVVVKRKSRSSVSPETELSTGFSLVFGNFTIDWLVNADIFVEGPYFLSGNIGTGRQPGVPVSTSLAVRYSFDSFLSGINSGETQTPATENKPAEPAPRGRI